jgi:putative protease
MASNYQHVGIVTHYFDRIRVAVVLLDGELYLDDWILVHGPHTEFEQRVASMQIQHEAIDKGEPGEEVAIKVDDIVREGDEIYLILAEAG